MNFSDITKLILENKIEEAKKELNSHIITKLTEAPELSDDDVKNMAANTDIDGYDIDNSIMTNKQATGNLSNDAPPAHGGQSTKRGYDGHVRQGTLIDDPSFQNAKDLVDKVEAPKQSGGVTNKQAFELNIGTLYPDADKRKEITSELKALMPTFRKLEYGYNFNKGAGDEKQAEVFKNQLTQLENRVKNFLISDVDPEVKKGRHFKEALGHVVNGLRMPKSSAVAARKDGTGNTGKNTQKPNASVADYTGNVQGYE